MTKITVKNKEGELLKTLEVNNTQTLLKQLSEADVEIPNACRMWMCAACMCTIESGGEYVKKDTKGEPAFPLWEDEVMTCIGTVEDTDQEIVLKTMY